MPSCCFKMCGCRSGSIFSCHGRLIENWVPCCILLVISGLTTAGLTLSAPSAWISTGAPIATWWYSTPKGLRHEVTEWPPWGETEHLFRPRCVIAAFHQPRVGAIDLCVFWYWYCYLALRNIMGRQVIDIHFLRANLAIYHGGGYGI